MLQTRDRMQVVLLLGLCCLAAGQLDHPRDPLGHMDIHGLVAHEVNVLVSVDSSMPLDECVAKCDDLFPMLGDHDETVTDRLCQAECEWHLQVHNSPDPGASHPPPSHLPPDHPPHPVDHPIDHPMDHPGHEHV